ncbi:MAG: hypothetical protein ACRDJM_08835 [Actinomycetota bacterium]
METFVVRVWAAPGDAPSTADEEIRGVIEHVRSGRSTSFRDLSELSVCLRTWRGTDGDDLGERGSR